VKKWAIIIASLLGVLISADSASAQELEPRIYAPAPVGTTIVLAGVGGSKGDILVDPSFDVANVEADLTMSQPAWLHVRTGRSADARVRILDPRRRGRGLAVHPQRRVLPGRLRKTERPLYSLQGCCPAPTDAAAARAPARHRGSRVLDPRTAGSGRRRDQEAVAWCGSFGGRRIST
jgi:hypothetical protein